LSYKDSGFEVLNIRRLKNTGKIQGGDIWVISKIKPSTWLMKGSIFLRTYPTRTARETWGQFHQHFTQSFNTRRSWNCKKDWQLDCLFCAFWICVPKICSQNIGEMNTCTCTRFNLKFEFHLRFNNSKKDVCVFIQCRN